MANPVLIVALTQRGKLLPSTYELLTCGRALAEATKEPLAAVVLGAKASTLAQDLVDHGADKVFVVENAALENFNDEIQAKAVADLVSKEGYTRVLVPGSVSGKSLAARLSVLLKA